VEVEDLGAFEIEFAVVFGALLHHLGGIVLKLLLLLCLLELGSGVNILLLLKLLLLLELDAADLLRRLN